MLAATPASGQLANPSQGQLTGSADVCPYKAALLNGPHERGMTPAAYRSGPGDDRHLRRGVPRAHAPALHRREGRRRWRKRGRGHPGHLAPSQSRIPRSALRATDDRGGSYGCWSGGGYGGGATPGEMLWRRDSVFAPAPDARAQALRLAVSAIEWVSHDPAQPGPTVEATQPVGWTLTVPVSS